MSNSIKEGSVPRFEVIIPDPDGYHSDRLWAVREPYDEVSTQSGYWLVCGDNTGSQSLVVHDYMLEPLIELLKALPRNVR